MQYGYFADELTQSKGLSEKIRTSDPKQRKLAIPDKLQKFFPLLNM
jgi:hypothetical protein